MAKTKRRWGDRRDGRWVRDVTGLQCVMTNLMPNRTDCEVCLSDKFDVTELVKYLDEKNASHPDYKTTLFHCILVAVARMIRERNYLNRFIQGRRTYERDEITLSFVAKRRFADGADEALMVLNAKDDDTLDTVSRRIVGDIRETRKSEHSTGGIDSAVDAFAKIPRLLLMFAIRVIRWLDFWGLVPRALTDGDPNYTTVLLSNLGSIMEDGTKQVRDVVDFCATLDERIADGFYFARSLKLIRHIFAHPEMLDKPIGEPSGFEYK